MAKVLHIKVSPRGERSMSSKAAAVLLEAYKQANPVDEVEELDLWEIDLPAVNGATLSAKYRILHGEKHTPEEADAWADVTACADHFKSADKYVISLPMWNFGIPYRLKHYLDVIVQPTLTFSFSPESGYQGLVGDKPAVVISSRGSAYEGDLAAMDHQRPYVTQILGFMGITNVREIVIQPTLASPDQVESVRAAALVQAREIGGTL
jgi:FMN-dependent NADH-azoreductase